MIDDRRLQELTELASGRYTAWSPESAVIELIHEVRRQRAQMDRFLLCPPPEYISAIEDCAMTSSIIGSEPFNRTMVVVHAMRSIHEKYGYDPYSKEKPML
jgi:hypothetical protein